MVFVRHGSVFVSVSPKRLCKVNPAECNEDNSINNTVTAKDQNDISSEEEKSLTKTEDDLQVIAEVLSASEEPRHAAETPKGEPPKLKVNDKIQYRMSNSDEWITASIVGRAG